MKRKIFLTSVTIVVLAIAVVGVNAYNYYSMPALMRANLEALADEEQPIKNRYMLLKFRDRTWASAGIVVFLQY